MEEALRCLTGKCLCAALRSKMASLFEPYQFGVAFPCGAERIAHGLRTCIKQHWSENDFGVLKSGRDKCHFMWSLVKLSCQSISPLGQLVLWTASSSLAPFRLLDIRVRFQQGDPLGPLLFSLVLNILVMKIARDSACSNIPFHVWYLDDGAVAGPRSSLCRILSKCEVFMALTCSHCA